MQPHILGVAGSALPQQREAIANFASLAEEQPGLALQAFNAYTSENNEATRLTRRVAAARTIVATLFEGYADQYIAFSPAVDDAAAGAREVWRRINHASRSTAAEDQAAKNTWRQARVGAFLTGIQPAARTRSAPRPRTPARGKPRSESITL